MYTGSTRPVLSRQSRDIIMTGSCAPPKYTLGPVRKSCSMYCCIENICMMKLEHLLLLKLKEPYNIIVTLWQLFFAENTKCLQGESFLHMRYFCTKKDFLQMETLSPAVEDSFLKRWVLSILKNASSTQVMPWPFLWGTKKEPTVHIYIYIYMRGNVHFYNILNERFEAQALL